MPARVNGLALSRFSVIYATLPSVITRRSPVQGSRAVPEHLCLTRPYIPKARTLPARVVGRGLLRPLPDNTASVAIWLGAGKPSREGDLTRKKSLAQAENEPIVASMPLPDDAKNKYVAPGMSAFTTATIEDMSETSAEQKYRWELLAELIFRARVDGPTKPTLPNLLRRADAAFEEYSLARSRTLAYLASPNVVMEYLAAITHWEVSSPRHIKPTAFSTCAREASSGSATAPFSNA